MIYVKFLFKSTNKRGMSELKIKCKICFKMFLNLIYKLKDNQCLSSITVMHLMMLNCCIYAPKYDHALQSLRDPL